MQPDGVVDGAGRVLPRSMKWVRCLAIVGPGILVMAGDNDAGGLLAYLGTGARYGAHLFLPLLLAMVAVTLVVQDTALRVGMGLPQPLPVMVRTSIGRGWAQLLAVQLTVQNWFTLVSEFAGMAVALMYFGIPLPLAVPASLLLVLGLLQTRSYRSVERVGILLAVLNLALLPAALWSRHRLGWAVPGGARSLSPELVFFAVGMIGNAMAPWMVFFQAQAARDRGLGPRDLVWARLDLVVGGLFNAAVASAVLLVGAAAPTHAFAPATFLSTLARRTSPMLSALIALALLDAGILACVTVALTTAWNAVDTWSGGRPRRQDDPAVRRLYRAALATAALAVWIPGAPPTLLAVGAQVVSAVLMPTVLVTLLLLANLPAMGKLGNGLFSNSVGILATLLFAGATVALILG